MSFVNSYTNFFKKYIPSPFSIAIILSFVSFFLAFILTRGSFSPLAYLPKLGEYWFAGMFQTSLMAFTVHMMLILVLGHIIALSKAFQNLINFALKFCTNTATAVFTISLLTILVSLFNWGLGLIFGAIFARKIGEHFQKENKKLNYALVGAAGYVGLMVWHGGLSGSAPLTVAGLDHSFVAEMGVVSMSETVFGAMNIFTSILLVFLVPSIMYFVAKQTRSEVVPLLKTEISINHEVETNTATDALEGKPYLAKFFGAVLFAIFISLCVQKLNNGQRFFNLLDLPMTNLMLLSLALLLHHNIKIFLNALNIAVADISGILIQFPLYFGIMGIMEGSGLAQLMANTIISTANEFTLPIYTFISSGIVNMFIPSGGGQWQVQAAILIESAQQTGTSIPKMIMALAYGDQLTNMLQPFWALPLLAITGLKAKDILPYTLILFLIGFFIFLLSIIIF